MKPTTSAATTPPVFVTDDDIRAAEARLCAALGAMREWAEAHGDNPAADRGALWSGYRQAHETLGAFCGLDAVAFGGGR